MVPHFVTIGDQIHEDLEDLNRRSRLFGLKKWKQHRESKEDRK